MLHSSASIGRSLFSVVAAAFALRPPRRQYASLQSARMRTRVSAAQLLPTEACVALLYVAPLPPVGTIIGRRWRRIRGAAVDNRDLSSRHRATKTLDDTPYSCWPMRLRAAAPLSKVALFFVALRLSDLPRYGAPPDEKTPSTPAIWRHVVRRRGGRRRAHGRGRAQDAS